VYIQTPVVPLAIFSQIMPAKSDQAKAKKKQRNAQRTKDAKPVQQWWFILAADKDEDGYQFARKTREEFTHIMNLMFAIAIAASKHESGLKSAAHSNPPMRSRKRKRQEESESETESGTESGTESETDTDCEMIYTSESEPESEPESEGSEPAFDDRSVEDFIVDHWNTLIAIPPEQFEPPRAYYSVTCLESKDDLNMYVKFHTGVSAKMLQLVRTQCVLAAFGCQEECLKLDPVQSEWGVLRYLTYGYSDDGHKSFEDVDHTPLFGHGDIPFKKGQRDEILRRTLECYEFAHWEHMEGWCWYRQSTMRYIGISPRVFKDAWSMYATKPTLEAANKYVSTHETRLAKLRKYAEIETVNYDQVENIYRILKWHKKAASEFRSFMFKHLGEDREDRQKQPLIVGQSGAGKGALTAPFKQLLSCANMSQSKSMYCWQHMNDKDLDCIVAEEVEKSLAEKVLSETAMCSIFLDTSDLQDPYCKLSAKLPFILNAQNMYFRVNDWKSLKRRLDIFELGQGPLPTEWEEKLKISGAAMSHFLFNPDLDARYADIEIPARPVLPVSASTEDWSVDGTI